MEFVLVGAGSDEPLTTSDMKCLSDHAEGIRLAAKIVDAPCADMHVGLFLEVCLFLQGFIKQVEKSGKQTVILTLRQYICICTHLRTARDISVIGYYFRCLPTFK